MIDLAIYPLGRGFYRVECDGQVVCQRSDEPLLDGARALHAAGHAPGTRISLRHGESVHWSLVSTVGGAANLTVREDGKSRPRFVQYQPYTGPRLRRVAPSMRFAGDPVPDSPETTKRASGAAADGG